MPAVSWSGRRPEGRVGHRGDRVGDEHLLAEAVAEAVDAQGEVVARSRPPHELVADLVEPDDRAGDELREERDVQREVERVAEVARDAAVDVDQ